MNGDPTTMADESLLGEIVAQVEKIMLEAEEKTKPVELDPYRGQLFELFVTAEGAGYLDEENGEGDLSADALCRILAERWGLKDAAIASTQQQTKLPPEHLSKMRLLWSVMRMWMEWTYAWQRWPEFNDQASQAM
ncbi:MAG: hypothetical protein Tsb009_03590 [Planctomycetaceae bacterium]